MGAESISYFTKSSYSQMPASLLDRAKRRRHFGGARVGQARRSGRRGAPQCGFVFACLPLAILLEGAVGHLNCLQIDRGTRRPLGVKPDQALLDLLDVLKRGVPTRLQLPRDHAAWQDRPARSGGPRTRLRIRPLQAPVPPRAGSRPPPARPPAALPPQHAARPRPECAQRPQGRYALSLE